MQEKVAVYFQRCSTYDTAILKDFFQAGLGDSRNFSPRGARILIKPNLVSAKGGRLACTNPVFLLALAEFLIDSGARVSIGDSPAFGSATSVLHSLGAARELDRRNIPVIDFRRAVRKRLSCGLSIGIAAEALECDYLINAPKIKAHSQMFVTLAVKNFFGVVLGLRKSMLHMRFGGRKSSEVFSRIIVDITRLFPVHFSVIDGIEAMHLTGPIHGLPLELNCLGAAEDPVALDTAILKALELDHSMSPLWLEARKRGYRGAEPENIRFPLCPPESFYGAGFVVPKELSPVRFNPFRFLWNNMRRMVTAARYADGR